MRKLANLRLISPYFYQEIIKKNFQKFQDRVIFYADSENGVEDLIRFHQMA
jgi:hypothetical protein